MAVHLLGTALVLAACVAAEGPAPGPQARPGTIAPITPATGDPLADFAAHAAPGTEGMVPRAGGAAERVKLVRHYTAASGRECREILTGSGMQERIALYCREGDTWVQGRPLLRTGSPRS